MLENWRNLDDGITVCQISTISTKPFWKYLAVSILFSDPVCSVGLTKTQVGYCKYVFLTPKGGFGSYFWTS
jgi:hypothetical protein